MCVKLGYVTHFSAASSLGVQLTLNSLCAEAASEPQHNLANTAAAKGQDQREARPSRPTGAMPCHSSCNALLQLPVPLQ